MENLKVTELKKELKNRGLSTVGTKGELLSRLQEAMADEKPVLDDSVLDDDSAILDDDDDVLDDEDDMDSDELVGAEAKNGTQTPVSKPPAKTAQVSSAIPAPTEEKQNGKADDEALPPKKRKKIEISREPIPAEPAADAATGETVPKASNPDKPARTSTHTLITAPEGTGEKVVKLSSAAVAAVDKAKLRQQKFGAVTPDLPTTKKAAVTPAVASDKAKKRGEKFGAAGATAVTTVGKVSLTPEEEAKLLKRKERFGSSDVVEAKKVEGTAIEDPKKEKRAVRFGGGTGPTGPELDEKKKARAARFSGGT